MRTVLAPVLGVVSDAWVVGFGIASLVFNALLSLAMWRLNTSQKKTEGLEDLLRKRTEDLIDTRFRELSHEVRGSVGQFMLTLEEVKGRMKESENFFDELGNADHVAEVKRLQHMDQVKDWIRDYTASKADVREHEKAVQVKFDRLGEQLAQLSANVAVIAEQVKHA